MWSLGQKRQPLPDDQFRELLRLRGEVGRLRKDVQELMQLKTAGSRREVMLASAERSGRSG